ncbi:MAG: ABC transporter ATP-binding protein, partial [Chloroflexi bacterium]|nr:ABC transporter ATP-binding protein [Chloroflexota bacterium]
MMHAPGRRTFDADTKEQARHSGRVVWQLLRQLRPYLKYVLAALGMVLISGASQGLGPWLIGRAIDEVIGSGDRSALALTMGGLAAVYLAGMLGTRFQIYFISRAGQNLLADLRSQVFQRIESLSLQYLESSQAGMLMSRLVNDIDALNSFFSQSLTQMIGAVFALLGIVVAMMALNWRLGLTVMAMLPVLWIVTNVFSRWARRAFRKTRETIGDVSADLEEELGGVKVAQAFNRTEMNVRRFAERNAANRDANVNANAVTSAFAPTMDVLSTLDMALVAAVGGSLALAGQVSVGVVVSFIQYVQNFFRPLQTVAQMWTLAQSAFAAAERVYDLLAVQPALLDQPGAKEAPRFA